jgi:predicted DCC family thiol-disulfide oxidoreductase YuxK
MIWDGQCGFCAYWIIYWQGITKDRVDYLPYQEFLQKESVIEEKHFKEAVRLIEPSGTVHSGAGAAFKSWAYRKPVGKKLLHLYQRSKFFRHSSDRLYQWVADHRNLLFKVTKLCFGSDPKSLKPFWAIYLLLFLYLLYYWW